MTFMLISDFDDMQEKYDDPADDFLEFVFNRKFGKTQICPKCNVRAQYRRVKNRKSFQCPSCANQLYPLKDTFMEKTTELFYWSFFIQILLNEPETKAIDLLEWSSSYVDDKYCLTYKTVLKMKKTILSHILYGKVLVLDKEMP